MIKRVLGRTGITVSEIAFGGVEIGIPYGIGVHDRSDMLSHTEAIKLLHEALDHGINLFDTARMYGDSETIMGKAFRDRRQSVVLSTKCRHLRNENGNIPGYTLLREKVIASLQESCRELQTDYVDIFMLHQADPGILQNEDVCRVFSELRTSGMTRAVGASTYTTEETGKAIDSGVWDVVQLPFNLMDQRQQGLFVSAAAKGVGIVIRSVLLKGLLSNRGKDLHPALKEVEEHVKKYRALITKSIPDLPTLAIRFALSFNEIGTVLIGMDRSEYLHKSLQAANGKYLDATALERAQQLGFPDPSFLDLPKWDRMGWLK